MIIQRLRATTSRLLKEDILKAATALDLIMFRYAYDKNYSYGVKCAPPVGELQELNTADIELLDKLRSRELSGNAARDAVHGHSNHLIRLICNKDLDCGATSTLVNKVHPGTVPVFKVQLAKEQPLAKVELPCHAEIKYDGVRLVILSEDEGVYFFTRNGKEVKLPNIKRALEARPFSHYMLDTEVTLRTGKCEDRTKVSGMINSAMHGGVIDESKLQFNVFDYMSATEFNLSHCSSLFWRRRQQAERLVEGLGLSSIVMAKSLVCTSIEGIENVYAEAIVNGYEGLILKHQNHKYTFKRSVAWTKMKEIKSVDLKCIGTEEGSGKYEGMVGALVCSGIVEGKDVVVRVGTGLTDDERYVGSEAYEGRVIEIKYNTVIQDKVTGDWSLFLPRFVCIRFDK